MKVDMPLNKEIKPNLIIVIDKASYKKYLQTWRFQVQSLKVSYPVLVLISVFLSLWNTVTFLPFMHDFVYSNHLAFLGWLWGLKSVWIIYEIAVLYYYVYQKYNLRSLIL